MSKPERIPRETRPRAYAGVALILDLLYTAREATGLDYDDLILWAAASAIRLRHTSGPHDAVEAPSSFDDSEGYLPRTLLAEVVGVPRETARRRINALIDAGVLEEHATSGVRAAGPFLGRTLRETADGAVSAVERFDKQLRTLGCRGIRD